MKDQDLTVDIENPEDINITKDMLEELSNGKGDDENE